MGWRVYSFGGAEVRSCWGLVQIDGFVQFQIQLQRPGLACCLLATVFYTGPNFYLFFHLIVRDDTMKLTIVSLNHQHHCYAVCMGCPKMFNRCSIKSLRRFNSVQFLPKCAICETSLVLSTVSSYSPFKSIPPSVDERKQEEKRSFNSGWQ